ncbi:hypothetical protein XFLAVUS301_53410 [Xanthobacter flavus]|nr:hypothetical protein XFLAVUS301_53410 [Xanthobacter flavus]
MGVVKHRIITAILTSAAAGITFTVLGGALPLRSLERQGLAALAALAAAIAILAILGRYRRNRLEARREWERHAAAQAAARRAAEEARAAELRARHAEAAANAAAVRKREEELAMVKRAMRLAQLEAWFLCNAAKYRLAVDAIGTADPDQVAKGLMQHVARQNIHDIDILEESKNLEVRAFLDRMPGYLVPSRPMKPRYDLMVWKE